MIRLELIASAAFWLLVGLFVTWPNNEDVYGMPDRWLARLQGKEVAVNLINPMPVRADNLNCNYQKFPNNSEVPITCNLTFWTNAAEYEIRGLDAIGGKSGKIVRVSEFKDPFEDGRWQGPDYMSNYSSVRKHRDPALLTTLRNDLSRFSTNRMFQVGYCQAEAALYKMTICVRENMIYTCARRDNQIYGGCTSEGFPIGPLFAEATEGKSRYTTAITAVAVQETPTSQSLNLALFDDTGRMLICQFVTTKSVVGEFVLYIARVPTPVKIFHLDSLMNPTFYGFDSKTKSRDLLDKWINNNYFMESQSNMVERLLRPNYAVKLKRSHVQAITMMKSATEIVQKGVLDFEHGLLCFANGYTGFFEGHQTSCDFLVTSPQINPAQIDGIYALHLDKKGNNPLMHVAYGYMERTWYQLCPYKRPNRTQATVEPEPCTPRQIQSPPNDITRYQDKTCAKTLVFYDRVYTVHEPGTDIYISQSSRPTALNEQWPYYVTAAFAVNTTFYLFTGTNMLHIRQAILVNCQDLQFKQGSDVRYAEDLIIPNNFHYDVSTYRPYLVDYREFEAGARDAKPGFNEDNIISYDKDIDDGKNKDTTDSDNNNNNNDNIKTNGTTTEKGKGKGKSLTSGTNLAAIIIALLLGLIILAGIIYIYCLRSTVDEDVRPGKSPKSPKSKRSAGAPAAPAAAPARAAPVVPAESLHMDTVRSGMVEKRSIIKPTKSAKSVKSIKSLGQNRKTTRSPISSPPPKSKKSFTSTKSAKSAGANRSRPTKSPGAAAKSLVAKTRGK